MTRILRAIVIVCSTINQRIKKGWIIMAVINITSSAEYESTVSKGKVVVDFWAVWCQPCRMMGPVLESLAEENPDITVVKVNVDQCPDLLMKFGIDAVPTLYAYNNGVKIGEIVGLNRKESILELFE